MSIKMKKYRKKIIAGKTDILNVEWATNRRDTNIVDPVLVSLEDRFGYAVKHTRIHYALFKLFWYRPKVLLLSNETGARENYELCLFADKLGIITIVMISEGLHIVGRSLEEQKKIAKESMWGHNRKREVIWDLKLVWSNSFKNDVYQYVSNANKFKLKVSGGTGFDSYTLLSFDKNFSILEHYKKDYKKIVLLIGYAFDLYPYYEEMDEEEKMWFYNQRFIVRDAYKKLIENNPDILFILKHHPGSINLDDTEFKDLDCMHYKNVIELHREVDIRDLLNLSDIVIAYDSTVCLEAWLMGKITLLFNPLGEKFRRSSCYQGSPIAKKEEELQFMLDEYYRKGSVTQFDNRSDDRKNVIEEEIQFSDGANYLRASKLINECIKANVRKRPSINMEITIALIKELLREIKSFLIEFTVLGFLNKGLRADLERSRLLYNTRERFEMIETYRMAINKFESRNKELVNDILLKYTGN